MPPKKEGIISQASLQIYRVGSEQARPSGSTRTYATKTVFELGEVFFCALFPVHEGEWIVLPDYAFGVLLNGGWGEVRFVCVLRWQMLEFGNPELDEPGGFGFDVETGFGIRARVVQPEIGHGEGSHTRKPKPISVVEGPIGVD